MNHMIQQHAMARAVRAVKELGSPGRWDGERAVADGRQAAAVKRPFAETKDRRKLGAGMALRVARPEAV